MNDTEKSSQLVDGPVIVEPVPKVSFSRLTFSDGSVVQLESNDIVVFVGPNNAGKSKALTELESFLRNGTSQKVIKSAEIRKVGTAEGVRQLLTKHTKKIAQTDGSYIFQGSGIGVGDRQLDHYWLKNLQALAPIFYRRIGTESRINDSNPQGAYSVLDQAPSNPIQMMFLDDKLERRIGTYFKRAFGKDLILYRAGGSQWPLLVGSSPPFETGESVFSASYNKKLQERTEPLDQQGDGMRSFASVILHTLAPATPSLLLLDEPEAFLHPPQAKLIGEIIAKERPIDTQLFVATHSLDVLQGLLAAAPSNLKVIRLQRVGEINRICEMDKEKAKAISADPILKHSSVMSGLFHERVIVCESDSDCMFYGAILDLPSVRGETQPDILFTYGSGKQRIAVLVDSLKSLDVNVDTIVDFDILSNLQDMKKIVESLRGDWAEIEPLAFSVKQAIEQHKPWLRAIEVVKEIQKIVAGVKENGEFPKSAKSEIDALFRKASPWDAIKTSGISAVPSGQATKQFQELCRRCSALGLWIVPVGELEGFCKIEGNHGPKWVQNVLSKYKLEVDPNIDEAREFVRAIWNKTPMFS